MPKRTTAMTLTEKRERLIKEIQNLPEEAVDKLLASVSPQEEKETEQARQEKIEAIIKEDFKRYHKVFKALA